MIYWLQRQVPSHDDHLKHVELVFQRLIDVGFAVNLRKSSFIVTEIDYLGYWIPRCGIQLNIRKWRQSCN
jgi:hypothetical protein